MIRRTVNKPVAPDYSGLRTIPHSDAVLNSLSNDAPSLAWHRMLCTDCWECVDHQPARSDPVRSDTGCWSSDEIGRLDFPHYPQGH